MDKKDTGQMIGIAKFSAVVAIPFVALECVMFAFRGELDVLSFAIVLVVPFFLVFFACSFLIWRDLLRHKSRLRSDDLSYEKILATKQFTNPQLLLNTRNSLGDFVNSPGCKILEHPAVTLNPLKAHRMQARGGVAASALFEIMLIMAIRARIDELLLRNTRRGCRVIHKSGETTHDVVPMPKSLTGRAINYYREIFGVRYPLHFRRTVQT